MKAQEWTEALNALGIKAVLDCEVSADPPADGMVNLPDAPDYYLQITWPDGAAYLVCTEDGEGEHYFVELDEEGHDETRDPAIMAKAIRDTIGGES